MVCPTGGIDLDDIAVMSRRVTSWPIDRPEGAHHRAEVGGEYQWRREGEYHLFNPTRCSPLQHSTRTGQYIFREYTKPVDDQSERIACMRGLLKFQVACAHRFRSRKSNRPPRS